MIARTKHALKTAAAALVLGGLMASPEVGAASPAPRACSNSTSSMYNACLNDANDSFWVNTAKCQNLSNGQDRRACEAEKRNTNKENLALCRAQMEAREDVCEELGEAPYDPQVVPANFVDPLQIGTSVAPNPYLILTPGYTRVYKSPSKIITVTVMHDTVDIRGVGCILSRDTVTDLDGKVLEDTLDYFAQDVFGNVWYFGETTAEYEDGFPVTVDGSFRAGVNRAKQGIGMLAVPTTGKLYREEFDVGNAEDLAKVVTTTASESAPAASCAGTCLLTDNFTPVSPTKRGKKYFAPGIGEIVEFPADDPTDREVLVEYHY